MAERRDPEQDPTVDGSIEDDTEGHSLSVVMGLDAIGRTRDRERARTRKAGDEELAPLTKTFPRLKDDTRK